MSVPSIEKLTALEPWTVVGVRAGDLLDCLASAADAVAAAHAELVEARRERDDAGLRWGEHYNGAMGELESQLAAALAQLAEARAWLALVRRWESCGESTGIASNRCMLPPGHVGAHDCQLVPGSFAYFAALSAAPQPEPDGPWAVDLICCDRDDGVQVCATWSEADAFRQSYIEPADHERSGILHRATPGTRLGYHGPAPSFPAGCNPEPPASDEPARCEHGKTGAHYVSGTNEFGYGSTSIGCPGPAASGTPDGGR